MYAYASPQGDLSSPANTSPGVHHHLHPQAYHHSHLPPPPQIIGVSPHHQGHIPTVGSPAASAGINSPTTSGAFLTSPTGSSVQLVGSPIHNGGGHPLLIAMPSGGPHMGLQLGTLQDPSGGAVGAAGYDNPELMELKKRRYTSVDVKLDMLMAVDKANDIIG